MADRYTAPAEAESAHQPGAQNGDPTQVSGQDPNEIFGIGISYKSGAAGSAGADPAMAQDPTTMANQYPGTEPISGVRLGGTGAPGSQGIQPGAGQGDTVMVTDPNYTAGRPGGGSGIQQIPVQVAVSGPSDSTATAQNYPPAHVIAPGVPAAPASTGAGQGSVRRGGNMRGQR